jgi:hypothetical protein
MQGHGVELTDQAGAKHRDPVRLHVRPPRTPVCVELSICLDGWGRDARAIIARTRQTGR